MSFITSSVEYTLFSLLETKLFLSSGSQTSPPPSSPGPDPISPPGNQMTSLRPELENNTCYHLETKQVPLLLFFGHLRLLETEQNWSTSGPEHLPLSSHGNKTSSLPISIYLLKNWASSLKSGPVYILLTDEKPNQCPHLGSKTHHHSSTGNWASSLESYPKYILSNQLETKLVPSPLL